ncbi:hypothetical protein BDB00DRAFT_872464 [Zychaea mexicana]|uniref:uncharacterized protein n=1 Tax=Zychaea mexicana TaxID=64656 RepID=UPI0022FE7E95|nr:uncharacterized protein BDB00DRAFT_872464 [Zychaea mexicana]KAI9493361.1 hypothetical protein BDB00DRAFT_872464 [Zychaea mexicana]
MFLARSEDAFEKDKQHLYMTDSIEKEEQQKGYEYQAIEEPDVDLDVDVAYWLSSVDNVQAEREACEIHPSTTGVFNFDSNVARSLGVVTL